TSLRERIEVRRAIRRTARRRGVCDAPLARAGESNAGELTHRRPIAVIHAHVQPAVLDVFLHLVERAAFIKGISAGLLAEAVDIAHVLVGAIGESVHVLKMRAVELVVVFDERGHLGWFPPLLTSSEQEQDRLYGRTRLPASASTSSVRAWLR